MYTSHTRRRYRTFVTHPWIFRSITASRERMLVNGCMAVCATAKPQRVEIKPVPLAEYTVSHSIPTLGAAAWPNPSLLAVRAGMGICRSHPTTSGRDGKASPVLGHAAIMHGCPSTSM